MKTHVICSTRWVTALNQHRFPSRAGSGNWLMVNLMGRFTTFSLAPKSETPSYKAGVRDPAAFPHWRAWCSTTGHQLAEYSLLRTSSWRGCGAHAGDLFIYLLTLGEREFYSQQVGLCDVRCASRSLFVRRKSFLDSPLVLILNG